MTQKTTRSKQYSFAGAVLFLAFELGAKEWKLGFSIGLGQKPRRRTIGAGELEALKKEIEVAKERFGLSSRARVVSCYEAGRDGFWLARYLRQMGIENVVVDSSSIEVNRRMRRAKSDRMDVEKLVKMLIRYEMGEKKIWSVVQVPSVEEEDRRQLHRELRGMKKEKTRSVNRIKALLATQGIRLRGTLDLSKPRLERIRLWDGSGLPKGMKGRLMREWEHVRFLKGQIGILESERRRQLREGKEADVGKIRQLMMLRGIGTNGAWLMVRELFGWREFKNRRQVGSIAGLTPTPYQSSDTSREQGISKAGNRHVRGIAIELAWSWIRYQPNSGLTEWFQERFGKAGTRARKVGSVALARRLLIQLWKFLETGAIPEGAVLKPTP